MDEKKTVMEMEKNALTQVSASERCLNNPPNEPYMVDTEEDIIAEQCTLVPKMQDPANIYLKLDVHVETAARLSRRDLCSMLMAGATTDNNGDPRMGIVKFIDIDASPAELAERLASRGNFFKGPSPTAENMDEVTQQINEELRRPPRDYEVVVLLDYPFNGPAAFSVTIPDLTRNIAIGDLVWAIGQAYRYIYADPEKFKIWGHALSDLYIEGIYFDTPQALVYPLIGS